MLLIFQIHYFEDDDVSKTSSFLNDIVVDSKKHLAYISDSGIPIHDNETFNPAIIVYDEEENEAERFLTQHSSVLPDTNFWLNVNGKKCFPEKPMMTGVDGIALSCDKKRLYWTPLSSREIYGIEVDYFLMYQENKEKVAEKIVSLGSKNVASDGLACSDTHQCYITDIEHNSVYEFHEHDAMHLIEHKTNFKFNTSTEMKKITNITMIWPDTIAFGDNELFVVSNNLCEWIQGNIDWNKDNFFIHNFKIKGHSYVNGCRPDYSFDLPTTIVGFVTLGVYLISIVIVLLTRNIFKSKE